MNFSVYKLRGNAVPRLRNKVRGRNSATVPAAVFFEKFRIFSATVPVRRGGKASGL